jgi:hypothetical protein
MKEHNLKELKISRANLKLHITVFNNFLDYKPSYDNFDEITARLQKIKITFEKFENIHVTIVLIKDKKECEKYRLDFEELYYSTARNAKLFLT